MGLDAHVCCDCFERGRLRSAPPLGCRLAVCADGSLDCGSGDLNLIFAFDRWQQSEACEHEDGYLIAHYLGNVALVASLRKELGRWPERFPMILSRVIYNATHGGDFIPAAGVPRLAAEVEHLAGFRCVDGNMIPYMQRFEVQMRELVAAAMRVGKAVVF